MVIRPGRKPGLQLQEDWAIDIARNKQILNTRPRHSSVETSSRTRETSISELQLMRSMSERIDKYGEILNKVIGI